MKTNSILVEHLIEQREACLEKMDELMGEMGIQFNAASERGFRRKQLRDIKRDEKARRNRVLSALHFNRELGAYHFPNRFEE